MHRRYVLWMRGNKQLTKFLQQNRFIYPFFVSFLLAAFIFPGGPGDFNAGVLTTHQQVDSLFSNFTWTRNISEMSVQQYAKMRPWMDPYTQNVFVSLTGFTLYVFFGAMLGCTLPVPAGIVIPSFKVGAGIGRIIGEGMAMLFPAGLSYGHTIPIVPGGYAVVGAAAFTGATTQTISIAMIIFEMTGQKTHCIPVLVAVIIANCIASLLGPSAFDSIILIKNLPYLPNIIPSSSNAYSYFVESFMLKSVKYIWHGMTYNELKQVLKETGKVSGFPLVDHPKQMVLLGSVPRAELVNAIQVIILFYSKHFEIFRISSFAYFLHSKS
jgi:chloride channel 2